MEMTKEEEIVLKMNILGGMNTYIITREDAELMFTWMVGLGLVHVSKEKNKMLDYNDVTEDVLKRVAEDKILFRNMCNLFSALVEIDNNKNSIQVKD